MAVSLARFSGDGIQAASVADKHETRAMLLE
jgi:hypothetical protein